MLMNPSRSIKEVSCSAFFSSTPTQEWEVWTCVRLGGCFQKVSRRNTAKRLSEECNNEPAEYGLIPQRNFSGQGYCSGRKQQQITMSSKMETLFTIRESQTLRHTDRSIGTPLANKRHYFTLLYCLVLQADINPSYLLGNPLRAMHGTDTFTITAPRRSSWSSIYDWWFAHGHSGWCFRIIQRNKYMQICLIKVESRLQAAQKEYELWSRWKAVMCSSSLYEELLHQSFFVDTRLF